MVSKMSDVPTAKVIAGSASEIRFYAGMRGEDTFSTLKAWIKAIGNAKDAAAALGAILSPRLVRKLCPRCRIPFKPDPAALQKMNLPPDKVQQLYKPGGKVIVKKDIEEPCPDCMGMGYRGRTGVFEVMVLDDEARKLIAQGQLDQLRAHLRKQKMLWLQEAALTRVVEGVTAIAEIGRALAKEEKAAPAA
jgi:type II secretory ATPase GspE/PulE/Tfp pilus assembly ATPase PilB-like protein